MFGNAADILKEDSGIFELLVDDDDDDDDSNNKFAIRKQSISNTGLEMQGIQNNCFIFTLFVIVSIAAFNRKLDSVKEEDTVNEDDVPKIKSQDSIQQDLPVDTVRRCMITVSFCSKGCSAC